MDARCRCGSPLTGNKTYCSARCRQKAYAERNDVVVLSTQIDRAGAQAFKMLCAANNLSASEGLHALVSGYIQATAAMMAGPPVHEPAAAERSTTTNVRT